MVIRVETVLSNRYMKGVSMRKAYVIKELETIFGCSRTAITKKITDHPDKPGVERYKNRFEVVSIDGKKAIMFSDEELEYEKRLSKGAKNVSPKGYGINESENIIDIEPNQYRRIPQEGGNVTELNKEVLQTFSDTIQKTLEETIGKELEDVRKERDNYKNQLLLLEDKRKENDDTIKSLKNENQNLINVKKDLEIEKKNLKKINKKLRIILEVVATVLVCFITFYITTMNIYNTISTPEDNVIENVAPEIEQKKEPAPQAEPKKSVKPAKQVRK